MSVLLPIYDDAHGRRPIVVRSVFVHVALDVDHADHVAWCPYFHRLAYYEPKWNSHKRKVHRNKKIEQTENNVDLVVDNLTVAYQ